MKLNIQKLQAGGGLGMLFSAVADPSSNAAQQTAQQSSSSKKDSSDDGILSKEVLNELRKHGLPNEVDQFEQVLAQLEDRIASGRGISSSQLASVRSMANRIIRQSSYLDTAITTAKDNKALGDVAVDQDGFIYATDENGKLQKVAFNKFDTSKYNALSYAELAEYRRNSPDLINNSDIIKTIQSGIGSEKINDFVQSILSKVGQTETKQEAYESLASIQGINPKEISNQELVALKSVAEAANQIGLDSIFKIEEFRKNSNVGLAMQYIMSILPKQMRAQLQGSYIAQGGSYKDSKMYAAQVMQTASLAAADNAYHFGIDYEASANKAAGTASSKQPKQHDLTMMELFFNGDLNHAMIKLSDTDYDNKTALEVPGTIIPGLTTDKNQPVTNLPLSLALAGQGMGKYLDYNKIFMGYQRVPEGMLQNIAYTKDQVANVWLPVDSNGDIDFRTLHNFSDAEKEIELGNVTSPEEKNKIHRKHGSPAYYDSNGNITNASGRMEQFLMLHGYTIDDYIDSNNSFVRELKGDEEDQIDNVINAIYKGVKKTAGFSKIAGKQKYDDIIQVPVFIKIQDNAAINAATYAGYGSLVDTNTLEQTMKFQDQRDDFTASGEELYITE